MLILSRTDLLRPVPDIRNLIHRDKCLRITGTDIVHECLILTLVHDRNDLIVLLKIVSTDRFIDRCAAVQIVNNDLAEFFLFLRDNADTSLDILSKNKVIEDDSVHICTEHTEHDGLLVINERGRKRHALPERDIAFRDPHAGTCS